MVKTRAGFFALILFLAAVAPRAAYCSDASWEAKYRSEPFLRLLREIDVKVNRDFTVTRTFHIIDKVQTEGGKGQGEIELDYDRTREELKDIEAYTVLPDGRRLMPDEIQDMNARENYGVYTDNRMKVITMPGVVVGSTVQWKVTKISREPAIPGNYYDLFYFSSFCPMQRVVYRLTVPAGMKLNTRSLNFQIEPRVETSGGEVTYTWEARETDKEESEEYMPFPENRYKMVAVSTLTGWGQLSDWSWPLFAKNLRVSPEMKREVAEITAGKKTTEAKIQAIVEYLQREMRFVSMNIDFHSYEPHPSDQVFANRYGDCKDQALLLVAMLSQIGVKARPSLLDSGSELRREDLLPMPMYFDHVIVSFKLDGKRYFTDVLAKGYNLEETPLSLSGKRTFTIDDRGGRFYEIPLSDSLENTYVSDEHVAILADGTAVVDVNAVFSRSSSVTMREKLEDLSAGDRENYLSSMERRISGGGLVLGKAWENLDAPYRRIVLRIKFKRPNWARKIGDMLIFDIPGIERPSVFLSSKRKYPVNFTVPSETDSTITYDIPAGYSVLSLPQKVDLDKSFASFSRVYLSGENEITQKEVYTRKRAMIPASKYQSVQDFFDEVSVALNDMVVLKKNPGSKVSSLQP